jgi:hypothetical protein
MSFFTEVEHVDEDDVNLIEIAESVDKDRMYSIIDNICMDNREADHIVSSCKILTDGINSILESAYAKIERKKQQQQLQLQQLPLGEPIDSGWEYIYLICETIFNSNYFITFTDNDIRDGGFREDIFYNFYREMGQYINSIIHQITTETVTNYIFAIITKFNSLFTYVQGANKRDFIITVAYHLPFAFLFDGRVEDLYPMLLTDMVGLKAGKVNECLSQQGNPGVDGCLNLTRQMIEAQMTTCTQTNSQESCYRSLSEIVGGSYKNNIIKKLKIKKRATKRRQHKSQIFKKLKKHKSQKQKIQRKYKSKKPRKHKLIFSKTFKKKI